MSAGVSITDAREAQGEARQRRHGSRFAVLEEAVTRLVGRREGGKAAGC